ncbi:MAG: hypothetical protein Kow0010_22540 [Dehalococcoidia bacterium]
MQLQENLAQFERAGIKVFAISYDSVEALSAFANEFGITYALLSDPDHRVIEATGILNTLISPEEKAFYGIPFPGVYVVGTDGTIEEKLFYQHYRTRPSAATVLREGFGVDFDITGSPHADASGEGVRVSVKLASAGMVFMERAMLYVDFELDDGLHLYGEPVPAGFTATSVEVSAAEGVVVEEPRYPPTTPFRVEGLPGTFNVFEGRLRVAVPIQSRMTEGDAFPLDVTVRFQACTDRECLLPQTRTFQLTVPIRPLARPKPAG